MYETVLRKAWVFQVNWKVSALVQQFDEYGPDLIQDDDPLWGY